MPKMSLWKQPNHTHTQCMRLLPVHYCQRLKHWIRAWQAGKHTSWLLMTKEKTKVEFYCSLVELWVTVNANKWQTHEERLMSASGRRTSPPPCQLGCLTNNKSITELFYFTSFHTLLPVQCVWRVIFKNKSSGTSTSTVLFTSEKEYFYWNTAWAGNTWSEIMLVSGGLRSL